MNKESADRIRQCVDEMFRSMGLKDRNHGIQFVIELFTWVTTTLRDPSRLDELLAEQPEPRPDELEQILQSIRQLPFLMRSGTLEFAKNKLPHDPGGRKSVLGTPSEQARRIEEVISLIRKKVKVTDALKQIARKEGISLSSMQRIWRRRGELSS
jgi:hypothetical protein